MAWPPSLSKSAAVSFKTVSGIAAAYGLDVASVLSANGLGPSSLIFPGESIVLPLTGTVTEVAATEKKSIVPSRYGDKYKKGGSDVLESNRERLSGAHVHTNWTIPIVLLRLRDAVRHAGVDELLS